MTRLHCLVSWYGQLFTVFQRQSLLNSKDWFRDSMKDAINYACVGVSVYIDCVISTLKLSPELMWLRIRQEADYKLECLTKADCPDQRE